MRPDFTSYPSYFNSYIQLAKGDDINRILEMQSIKSAKFYQTITEEQSNYRYAEEKWSIKDILQHVIDAERIFTYRVLAIARGEKAPLPSFDEQSYARKAAGNRRSWKDLVEEFNLLRASTLSFVRSISEEEYLNQGQVNDYRISILALLYVIAGHEMHHINIIRERYFDVVSEES